MQSSFDLFTCMALKNPPRPVEANCPVNPAHSDEGAISQWRQEHLHSSHAWRIWGVLPIILCMLEKQAEIDAIVGVKPSPEPLGA